MNILDLKPSITDLPIDEAMKLISDIRFSRRQSKQPAKRAEKAEVQTQKRASKGIGNMSPETARRILEALKDMVGG